MPTKLFCEKCDVFMYCPTPVPSGNNIWLCPVCRVEIVKYREETPMCLKCETFMSLTDNDFMIVYPYGTPNENGTLWMCPKCGATVGRITELPSSRGIRTREVARHHVGTTKALKKHSGGYGAVLNKELM